MSYRAFKHLLGETSLERKCRFLFGAGTLLLITASFWFYALQTEHLAYEQTTDTLWAKFNGGNQLFQISKSGVLLDTLTFAAGRSPAIEVHVSPKSVVLNTYALWSSVRCPSKVTYAVPPSKCDVSTRDTWVSFGTPGIAKDKSHSRFSS